MYIDAHNRDWLAAAEQLLFAYRDATGRTRGELEEQLADLVGDGPGQLIHQGLAKLLEDRCDFEVAADVPPDQVREAVFRTSAEHHASAGKAATPFDRNAVLTAVAGELHITPEQVESSRHSSSSTTSMQIPIRSRWPRPCGTRVSPSLRLASALWKAQLQWFGPRSQRRGRPLQTSN